MTAEAIADDIARIAEQELALVFDRFDEARAFAIGSALRERGLAAAMPIVIEIRFWDRLLFYAALPGSTQSNAEWIRRKMNVVRVFQKSTYRMGLEQTSKGKAFYEEWGLSLADFVLAGGEFPLKLKGAGVIGAFGVSGLPQRQDHEFLVGVLCEHLGQDYTTLALTAP